MNKTKNVSGGKNQTYKKKYTKKKGIEILFESLPAFLYFRFFPGQNVIFWEKGTTFLLKITFFQSGSFDLRA